MSVTATESDTQPAAADEQGDLQPDEVLAELLVEEISIDGMCGVY